MRRFHGARSTAGAFRRRVTTDSRLFHARTLFRRSLPILTSRDLSLAAPESRGLKCLRLQCPGIRDVSKRAVITIPQTAGLLFIGGALAVWLSLPPVRELVSRIACGPLQKVAMAGSTWLLQTAGCPAVGEDTLILINESRLAVTPASSGLNTLVIATALSSAVALFLSRPLWERLLIAGSGAPLAVLCNALRIAATGIALQGSGHSSQTLTFDWPGLLTMPLCGVFLSLEILVLSRLLIPPPARDVVPVGSRRASPSA